MTTRRKGVLEGRAPSRPQAAADALLGAIARTAVNIAQIDEEYRAALAALVEGYEERLAPLRAALNEDDAALKSLMRQEKQNLFGGGADVIYLAHGALIHSLTLRVTIPRDALAKCEELGFAEVIKIAKSLDRETVEKWPDERLFLIGAERKPKEVFSYELKKETAK